MLPRSARARGDNRPEAAEQKLRLFGSSDLERPLPDRLGRRPHLDFYVVPEAV